MPVCLETVAQPALGRRRPAPSWAKLLRVIERLAEIDRDLLNSNARSRRPFRLSPVPSAHGNHTLGRGGGLSSAVRGARGCGGCLAGGLYE
jgi:hypothetical protein